MDKNTRKLLELTDKHLSFGEDWLEYRKTKGIQAQVIKATLTYIPTYCEHHGVKNKYLFIKNESSDTHSVSCV